MISKTDCLLLLSEISDNKAKQLAQSVVVNGVSTEVIKFLNEHRELDLSKFYEKLRHSYNNKKSKLFGNIVKEKEDTDIVLTTLASLQLQVLLFSNTVEDKQMFLRHARFTEIAKCLAIYGETNNLIPSIKLLKLIKADICAFQYIKEN